VGDNAAGHRRDARSAELAASLAELRCDAVRFACNLVGTSRHPDPEDLVHTAMANVLAQLGGLEEPTALRSYLFTSIANAWRNDLRTAGRRRVASSDELDRIPSSEATPEEHFFAAVDDADAVQAFKQLSKSAQAFIWMRHIDGLSYREMATELGMNKAAVRQRVHRARGELKAACVALEATEAPNERYEPVRSRRPGLDSPPHNRPAQAS
jgi:RNA polymerase sigma-70 factor, ECF subfamily